MNENDLFGDVCLIAYNIYVDTRHTIHLQANK